MQHLVKQQLNRSNVYQMKSNVVRNVIYPTRINVTLVLYVGKKKVGVESYVLIQQRKSVSGAQFAPNHKSGVITNVSSQLMESAVERD